MSPRAPRDPYLLAIADVWDTVDIYRGSEIFATSFGAIEPVRATIFAANFCQSEVRNGGLHQFFHNPTGVLAPEACEAFRRLGLPDTAAVVEDAMRFFGPRYPREAQDRQSLLSAVPGDRREEWDPFLALDKKFYASLRGPDGTDRFETAANLLVSELDLGAA